MDNVSIGQQLRCISNRYTYVTKGDEVVVTKLGMHNKFGCELITEGTQRGGAFGSPYDPAEFEPIITINPITQKGHMNLTEFIEFTINYKTSATLAQKAEIIAHVSRNCARQAAITRPEIDSATAKLSGVCYEGRQRFADAYEKACKPPAPEYVTVTIRFKPDAASTGGVSDNVLSTRIGKVFEEMADQVIAQRDTIRITGIVDSTGNDPNAADLTTAHQWQKVCKGQ